MTLRLFLTGHPNGGWLNFNPANGGVIVGKKGLSGYAWVDTIGWIRLGSNEGAPYANTTASNWGVNNDGAGNLSGYAWSSNAGWINFNPANGEQIKIDASGKFSGYAWSDTMGWIHLAGGAGTAAYKVATSWNPMNTVTFAAGPGGSLTGSTAQTVLFGGACTVVTAIPSTGYHFANWTGAGGFAASTDNPLTVVNVTADMTITANFALKTDQAITYAALPSKTFGDAHFGLSATASSGLTVVFSSSDASVASVSGSTLSIVGAGSSTITASQAGNSNFNAASPVAQTLTVAKATPTVTAWPTPGAIAYGQPLSASTLTGGSASVAGVFAFDSPESIPSAGTCPSSVTFTPSDAKNHNAVGGRIDVAVGKAVTLVTLENLSHVYDGTAKAAVASTTPSGLAVTLVYGGSASAPVGAGSHLVVATVNDVNYSGSASGTLEIAKASLMITADGKSKTYGAADPVLSATYSGFVNGETSAVVAGLALARASGEDVGSYPIAASGGAAANYVISYTKGVFTVVKADQSIVFASMTSKTVGDADSAAGASATSNLAISYASSNLSVATIASGLIHIVGVGSCVITASQPGNSNYSAAADVQQALKVNPRLYALTVKGGNGSGSYVAGASAPIAVNPAPSGMVFDKWTGDTATIADTSKSETTLSMPTSDSTVTANYRDTFSQPFKLTVANGSGSGYYMVGAVISIRALAAPEGKIFDKWIGQASTMSNVRMSTATLSMPAADVSIAATYKDTASTLYALTVANGSGSGKYTSGTLVEITASSAPSGMYFDHWEGDAANLVNAMLPRTTVCIPAVDISVTAFFKELPPDGDTHELRVVDGMGSGSYKVGRVVPVMANPEPDDKIFTGWSGDTARLESTGDPMTTITMPATNATITAMFIDVPPGFYKLAVVNGSGGGIFKPGDKAAISAYPAPSGMVFKRWLLSDGLAATNQLLADTTATMPAAASSATAIYVKTTQPPAMRNVTVAGGMITSVDGESVTPNASGMFADGTLLGLKANTPGDGMIFNAWCGAASLAPCSPDTLVVVDGRNLDFEATYRPINSSLATLVLYMGDGLRRVLPVLIGTRLVISAVDRSPEGKVFYEWILISGSSAIVIDDSEAARPPSP